MLEEQKDFEAATLARVSRAVCGEAQLRAEESTIRLTRRLCEFVDELGILPETAVQLLTHRGNSGYVNPDLRESMRDQVIAELISNVNKRS